MQAWILHRSKTQPAEEHTLFTIGLTKLELCCFAHNNTDCKECALEPLGESEVWNIQKRLSTLEQSCASVDDVLFAFNTERVHKVSIGYNQRISIYANLRKSPNWPSSLSGAQLEELKRMTFAHEHKNKKLSNPIVTTMLKTAAYKISEDATADIIKFLKDNLFGNLSDMRFGALFYAMMQETNKDPDCHVIDCCCKI